MKAAAGIVVAWGAAAVLASRLPAPDREPGSDPSENSAVAKLFGSSREVVSRQLYVEADRYFHKGVLGHTERALEDHLFVKWADAIAPRSHEELEGDSIDEILPWLHLATRADPGNIDAYSTAAYWLHAQGKFAAARDVLIEAASLNPGDYRVPQALGLLYYRNGDDALAVDQFEQARTQWPFGQDPADRQAQLDLSAILSFRAALHERLGDTEQALDGYREIVRLFPGQEAIRERLHRLEHGHEEAGDPEMFWADHLGALERVRGGRHVAGGWTGDHAHHDGCGHDHGPEQVVRHEGHDEGHDEGHAHEHHAGCDHMH